MEKNEILNRIHEESLLKYGQLCDKCQMYKQFCECNSQEVFDKTNESKKLNKDIVEMDPHSVHFGYNLKRVYKALFNKN
jgi:hypothetical protein